MKKLLLGFMAAISLSAAATVPTTATWLLSENEGVLATKSMRGSALWNWSFECSPGFTFNVVKGTSSTVPQYMTTYEAIAMGGPSTINVTSVYPVTQIVFDLTDKDVEFNQKQCELTANVGTVTQTKCTEENQNNHFQVIWNAPEGEPQTSIQFTTSQFAVMGLDSYSAKYGTFYPAQISATYLAPEDIVADPEFITPAGEYLDEVTVFISCETEGASIYYTTNSITTPTQYTEEGVKVTSTTTITAWGVKDETESEKISAKYVIKSTPANIAQISSKIGFPDVSSSSTSIEFPVNFDVVVTGANANNVFIADASGYGYVFSADANFDFKPGDVIKGNGWKAVLKSHQQANQIIPVDPSELVKDGVADVPAPLELTNYGQLKAANLYRPAVIKMQALTEPTQEQYEIQYGTQDTEVYAIWNRLNIPEVEAGTYNIYGIVYRFGIGVGYGFYLVPVDYAAAADCSSFTDLENLVEIPTSIGDNTYVQPITLNFTPKVNAQTGNYLFLEDGEGKCRIMEYSSKARAAFAPGELLESGLAMTLQYNEEYGYAFLVANDNNDVVSTGETEAVTYADFDPAMLSGNDYVGAPVKIENLRVYNAFAANQLNATAQLSGQEINLLNLYGLSADETSVGTAYIATGYIFPGIEVNSFVPEQMDLVNGVAEILASDLNDAEFYSLQGIKVNAANLQSGIYVAVKNGKSTKVMIQK